MKCSYPVRCDDCKYYDGPGKNYTLNLYNNDSIEYCDTKENINGACKKFIKASLLERLLK